MKGNIDADTWNLDATTFSSNLCVGERQKEGAIFLRKGEGTNDRGGWME